MNVNTNISDVQAVDTELAKARYDHLQDACVAAAAGITGLRSGDIIAKAEIEGIKEILVEFGVCSERSYYNVMSAQLLNSMADLSDQGVIDISAYELDEHFGDEE